LNIPSVFNLTFLFFFVNIHNKKIIIFIYSAKNLILVFEFWSSISCYPLRGSLKINFVLRWSISQIPLRGIMLSPSGIAQNKFCPPMEYLADPPSGDNAISLTLDRASHATSPKGMLLALLGGSSIQSIKIGGMSHDRRYSLEEMLHYLTSLHPLRG
jgi:hypothetical protein